MTGAASDIVKKMSPFSLDVAAVLVVVVKIMFDAKREFSVS